MTFIIVLRVIAYLMFYLEVVAQLVECSPINLLACASVGSNPVTANLCP